MLCGERRHSMSKYTIVGGGWDATSKTNEKFVRIQFRVDIPEGAYLTMWRNKRKNGDKSPDYLIATYISDEEPDSSGIF